MDKDKLFKLLEEGLNCSQTVLTYYADRYKLEKGKAIAIAQPFESGVFTGGTCGAVSGAYMVLGLEYSSTGPETRDKMREKVEIFNQKYTEKMGSLICKDILNLDISTEEGFKKALEEKKFEEICPRAMVAAIEVLDEMVKK